MRETLVLEYAEVLSGHCSLWQVGVLYLDHCGSSGTAMAQVVLERQPLTSDAVAHKVVQMSRDRKFDNVGKCWHDTHTKSKMRSRCLKYVLYQNPVLYVQLIYF